MLTPTDIHILVGILLQNSAVEDLDITLGHWLMDKAAGKKRDIDITVINNDKKELKYLGLEVKNHKRKFVVEDVEQLCIKLKDIDSIQQGGIISASGYTPAAESKAKAHGIELFELRKWEPESKHFEHFIIPADFELEAQVWSWNKINSVDCDFENLNRNLDFKNLKLKDKQGNLIESENLSEYMRKLPYRINLSSIDELTKLKANSPSNVVVNLQNNEQFTAFEGTKNYKIKGFKINGILVRKIEDIESNLKILVKLGDPSFDAGCLIAELADGNIIGFSSSNTDKSVKLIVIPISQRIKKKIKEIKLKTK